MVISLMVRRKGIYSNKEMKAIPSFIMYVMNKMELFHNTIHIRCLFRQNGTSTLGFLQDIVEDLVDGSVKVSEERQTDAVVERALASATTPEVHQQLLQIIRYWLLQGNEQLTDKVGFPNIEITFLLKSWFRCT